MKYTIGYIDEEPQFVDKFKRDLEDYFEIKTFKISPETSIDNIIQEIINAELDCLLVDFELNETEAIQFNGNEIVDNLRKLRPYFPVFIITGKEEDDVLDQVEDGDIVRLKEELNDKREILVQRIKIKIESYLKQIATAETTIKSLIQKRDEMGGLSIKEGEQLHKNYTFLNAVYPEEITVPETFIQPNVITEINSFSNEAREILEELKKLNNNG
ncbi:MULTISPECIES: hypothetical protein [Sphingobacterium]|uniref:hypothetical protein n=1 Tax=Sphingobacterium TaxID=28453 RepID=UPI0025797501|nr:MULTISPECIES: hypothetical protein [Sphingobacterium]